MDLKEVIKKLSELDCKITENSNHNDIDEKLDNIKSHLEDIEGELLNIKNKVYHLCGSDMGAQLLSCWNVISIAEGKINDSYNRFHEEVDANRKSINHMMTEFKGLISLERSKQVKISKAIREVLEE